MVKQIVNKIIAILVVLAMTAGNLILVATESYAAYEELEQQKTVSSDKNVSFDTYFCVGENNVHSVTLNSTDEAIINFQINVGEGYLKDSVIELSNANYKIESIEYQSVENIVNKVENNKITLNHISSNTQVVISAKIKNNHSEMVEADYCGRETIANFVSNYTNIKGKTKQINSVINTRIDWVNEATSFIDINAEKYMMLNNKTILQTKVMSGINDNVLPIKNTNIKTVAPKINGILPEEVRVYTNKTVATNGEQNGDKFSKDNVSYNKENGEVIINLENIPNEENKISWKSGADEYVVIYIYNTTEVTQNVELIAQNTLTTYTNTQAQNNISKMQEIVLTGNNVDFEVSATQSVSKGYIYANSQYETEYKSIWSANISYIDATEGLIFAQSEDVYNKENGSKLLANTYYKNTKINKVNFEKILGTEGQVQIYSGETLVGVINKNTPVDESGNMVFTYNAQINNIKIQTTKPISEGKLVIENNKSLTATSNYIFEELKALRNIETNLIGISENQEQQLVVANTELQETTTKAQIEIGKQNLSTVVTNENVEIRVVLEADDITDDLYKNSNIRIELPEEVEKLNLKSANILFNNEMKIETASIENNRIINLGLLGEQTQYIQDGNRGLTIILNTDITLRKTASSKETQVRLIYTNEKAVALENNGIVAVPVNISAPTGIITLNTVTNEKTGETLTSIESQKEEGKLERNTQSTIAKYKITVVNNNNKTINNVKILGTIPSQGDKYGSTINTKFVSAIASIEGINTTIYYSENLNATSDISNQNNGWNTQITENSKAYLIVLNEEVEQGKELNFVYSVELPENLQYGEKAISSYNVEYKEGSTKSGQIASIEGAKAVAYAIAENSEEQGETITETATPVVLTTGDEPILEATLKNNVVDETAYVGQYVTYKITIENKGTADATNVKVNMNVPDGLVYTTKDNYNDDVQAFEKDETIKNVEINIEKIEKNASITKEVVLYVKEANKTESVTATINSSNITDLKTNTLTIKTLENIVEMEFFTEKYEQDIILEQEYSYYLHIINRGEDLNNAKIKIQIPEGLEYLDASIGSYYEDETIESEEISYSEKTRTVEIKVNKLDVLQTKVILNVVPTSIVENKIIYASLICDEGTQNSNLCNVEVKKMSAEVTVESNKNSGEYIKAEDYIEYNLSIKNTGNVDLKSLYIKVDLSDEFEYSELEVEVNGEKIEYSKIIDENVYSYSSSKNFMSLLASVNKNETKEIKIKAPIIIDLENEEDIEIKTKVSIEDLEYEKEFTYILEKYNGEDDEDEEDEPSKPVEENKYKITGNVWLDIDKNGKMEDTENRLQGITVKAVNSSGNIASTATTDSNGKYTLENLLAGNYTVVFDYDTSKYGLTTYQKQGIDESVNSNVIKGTYAGKDVATTNTIEITDRSIANINMGLIEGSKFDLSLTKKVTQISMVNTKTTKTKKYDTQLAKIDLDYKYINNTKVAVEYEITVTNEGDIPGYATRIVDYLPKEFDFSTELNKDWYTSGNNIETKALENNVINPGESQTVTLILTKNMTENDNGIVCNTAEIAETYNEYGQEDIDSIPENNKEGEDDISSANVILGLKTGGPIVYITLTITIMALISIGAYEINKRVLKI